MVISLGVKFWISERAAIEAPLLSTPGNDAPGDRIFPSRKKNFGAKLDIGLETPG
jgi:hypothetical protein